MKFTWFYVFVVSVLTFPNYLKAADCSKELTEKKTQEICQAISEKGVEAKKSWPGDLLYENCGNNYVWVQDTSKDIRMVMHPIKRKLDGTSLTSTEDENKFKLFVEFDKTAKAKPEGAWVDYVWPKAGATKATPKTSFVKLCKMKDGTAWVAGSGIWKDDIK